MEKFVSTVLGSPWWLLLAAAVYGVSWSVYRDLHEKDVSCERWADDLERDVWGERYRATLGAWLDRIDDWLTPDIPRKSFPDRAWQVAWSGPLLDRCLVWAMAYPVLLLFGQWAIAGTAASVGTITLLEAEDSRLVRGATIGGLALGVGCIVLSIRASSPYRQRALFVAGMGMLVAGAGAGAVAGGQEWLGRRLGRPALCLVAFAALMLLGVLFGLAIAPIEPRRHDAIGSMILFLVVLPILNALADFGSIGLTRHLLRRSLTERGWRRRLDFLLDALGAVAALVLLGFAFVAVCRLAAFSDGTALYDLDALLADIDARPNAYWWLYLGFASTLLPTLAHLAVGSFGFVLMTSSRLRDLIAGHLRAALNGDVVKGRWAVQMLCLSMTATIVLPLVVLGHLVEHHAAIGGAYLDLMRDFAALPIWPERPDPATP